MKARHFAAGALAAFALLAAGCRDGLTGPEGTIVTETVEPGTVRFAGAGAFEELVQASGAPSFDRGLPAGTGQWAVAGLSRRNPEVELVVVGYRKDSLANSILIAFSLPADVAEGPYEMDRDCDFGVCVAMSVFSGVEPDAPRKEDAEMSCAISDGDIIVRQREADRLEGTFSGIGLCEAEGVERPQQFAIEGYFDVDIVEEYSADINP